MGKEINFIGSKACKHPLKMLRSFHYTLRIIAVGKQKFESPVELHFRKGNGIKTGKMKGRNEGTGNAQTGTVLLKCQWVAPATASWYPLSQRMTKFQSAQKET